MEIVMELRISGAMAGAMFLALPVPELVFGEDSVSAFYKAAAITTAVLLVAAAVLFRRVGRDG